MRRAVKSLGAGVPRGLLLSLLAFSSTGTGQLLLGQGTPLERQLPALDSRIPRGAEQVSRVRPERSPEPPACSDSGWLCVHRDPGTSGEVALRWLTELEVARRRLVDVLGLPPPLPGGTRGGALDLYMVPGAEELVVSPDQRDLVRRRDTASAFCTVGSRREPGARDATLCVAEALEIGLDASETPFSRRALAVELWLMVGAPTSEDAARLDDVQAHPERAIVARDRTPFAEGAALFDELLGVLRGGPLRGDAALSTYALSAGAPSGVAFRYVNEPDTLDVLRATFGPRPSDAALLFMDLAVARAFVGSRDTSGRVPALGWLGDLGRVRFEWSVPFSSLPRRLAPAQPLEPTGATYLWLELDRVETGATLAFRAEWEPPAAFQFALVALDRDGRIVRRVDVPFLERGTTVDRTLSDMSGAAGVLIVGTNLGGLGPSYPFDPDFEPYEPHSCTVYLARQ